MSDKTSTIALVVFWSILLLSISFLLGVRSGKHSADRWWQAHQDPKSEVQRAFELIPSLSDCSIECLVAQGHQPYIVSARKCTDPQPMDCFQPKPAPAGIGKPQAQQPSRIKMFGANVGRDGKFNLTCELPTGTFGPPLQCYGVLDKRYIPEPSSAARPKTWPPDCKLPSCAPVSTEPLHWADGTCTDFFTQQTIPCPLKLGKPPCCSAVFETIPERLCESPRGCTSLPKDMAFFSILESDDVYDGKSDKFYARCSVKNHVSAYCESIKPPEGEAVDFRTGKLGKRKPAPQQGGCTPEMGPGCAFIDNSPALNQVNIEYKWCEQIRNNCGVGDSHGGHSCTEEERAELLKNMLCQAGVPTPQVQQPK